MLLKIFESEQHLLAVVCHFCLRPLRQGVRWFSNFKRCYLRICSLLRSSTLSTKVVKYCLTWNKFINTYDDYALCWLLYTCIGVPEPWQHTVKFVWEAIYDTTVVEKGQRRGTADQVATKTNNYRAVCNYFLSLDYINGVFTLKVIWEP